MHYRNGREAKNGDKIVRLNGCSVEAFGVLHGAVPGSNFCNGHIAVVQSANEYACLCDCLHVDDVAAALVAEGLGARPSFSGPDGSVSATLRNAGAIIAKIGKEIEDLQIEDGDPPYAILPSDLGTLHVAITQVTDAMKWLKSATLSSKTS